MIKEIILRKDYLQQESIESVYLGGGTPSLLTKAQLDSLFNTLYKNFSISPNAEITIEANPDDLNDTKTKLLKQTPINRLSIGVQSFFDEELKWMNRAHNASEAIDSIKRIQDNGFENITIDLIYGSPTLTDDKWIANLQKVIDLNLMHVSSYCLTIEPKTALYQSIKRKKLEPLNEEQAAKQFEILVKKLGQSDFEQYEISNFARNNNYAIHNTNYWKNKAYLGIGPSAHSFNKLSRSWNTPNNMKYLKAINQGIIDTETETLSIENRVNEYIMTSLRTIWGFDKAWFKQEFGHTISETVNKLFQQKIALKLISETETHYILNSSSRIMADGIASDLFLTTN